jgi:hypothetical protein
MFFLAYYRRELDIFNTSILHIVNDAFKEFVLDLYEAAICENGLTYYCYWQTIKHWPMAAEQQ